MTEFVLKIEPAERATFAGTNLGTEPVTIPLKVANPSKERIAYKVKCTSNEIFRIRPPVGFLKSGDTCTIQLTFNAGKSPPENNKHYVAVYYIKAEDEKKTTARQAWSEHKGEPSGTKRIYIDFKKEDGAKEDKKDEKKDDRKDENDNERKDDKKEEKKEDDKKVEKEDKKEDDKKVEKEEKKDDDKKDDKKEDDKKDEKNEKKDDDKKDDDKKEDDKKE